MSEALVLKYRPQKFQDIVGNRLSGIVLQNMVELKQVPHALLFSGPSGVGKTTTARILAAEIQASDVIEVDAASTGGVDAIRSLIDVTRYSTGGGQRILILDEAQSITRQGFEALLKTLEEPPENTTFVLVTTEAHKIPETILSRLAEFTFQAVSENDILLRLQHISHQEELKPEDDLLRYLAQRARGNVRTAIQSLDMAARSGELTYQGFVELSGDQDVVPILLAAVTTGDPGKLFQALDRLLALHSPSKVTADLVACIIDILVLKSGGTPRVSGASRDRRERLSQRLDREGLLLACKILWDAQTALRSSEDPRGTLELSLVLISGAFGRTAPEAPASVPSEAPAPPRKLTLAEMQQAQGKESE